jgi:hypothetical protein
MRLEGTLDAFSLPDIFQLLSFTKKTGTLHLRRNADGAEAHGVVHLREGAVTGARSDVRRQALGRRIVGAGLADDKTLAAAVARVRSDPSFGLARALAEAAPAVAEVARELAAEQATDAVFDLLRWPDGEFAFVVDEADPDDLGASLPVDDVVVEARRRIDTWSSSEVPAPDAVVSLVTSPTDAPTMTRDEWTLLALVDGHRTVADFVALSGRGEYAVVSALSALVARGLLTFGESTDGVGRRQELLAELEGLPAPTTSRPVERPAEPARAGVIPERPEPFTPVRQPEHAEPSVPSPAYARSAPSRPVAAPVAQVHGSVHGSVAMQPVEAVAPAPSAYIERDPSVNKSLLLRLIAGVRGL